MTIFFYFFAETVRTVHTIIFYKDNKNITLIVLPNTIIQITTKRHIEDRQEESIRYYISSLKEKNASYFNHSIRVHWSIENQLHWHLDVTLKEDASRARKGFAPQNLNCIPKIALQLINNKTDNLSIQKRRFKASLDIHYLNSFF